MFSVIQFLELVLLKKMVLLPVKPKKNLIFLQNYQLLFYFPSDFQKF